MVEPSTREARGMRRFELWHRDGLVAEGVRWSHGGFSCVFNPGGDREAWFRALDAVEFWRWVEEMVGARSMARPVLFWVDGNLAPEPATREPPRFEDLAQRSS